MRGRIAGVGVSALVLVATLAALGAPAASAACPNEAFRTGPSALLPECRAYEQVTPVDKESGEAVTEVSDAVVDPSGDEIYFSAPSSYAGAQQGVASNPYLSTRTGEAWGTRGVGATLAAPPGVGFQVVGAISPDLGRSLVTSNEPLAPGAFAEGSNIYLRDNQTEAFILVEAIPGEAEIQSWISSLPFRGGDADFTAFLIETSGGISEFREGRLQPAIPGSTSAGTLEGAIGLTPNVMSADGSSFFYVKEGFLYQHRLGQETLLVSEDAEGNAFPIAYQGFVGASPDGDVAFFRGQDGLLYRFQATAPAGARASAITPAVGLDGDATQVSAAYVSEDGSTVYFIANDRLTTDAEPAAGYVYGWREEPGRSGGLRVLPDLEGLSRKEVLSSVSPDGGFLGVEARGPVTGEVVEGPELCPRTSPQELAGPCSNVFLYSWATDHVVCASCNGSAPVGNSRLGGADRKPFSVPVDPVLDDGTVLFDTPNPLTARDSNGLRDVYGWRNGQTQLISTGTSSTPSTFIAASPDGSDLFFATSQSLVGQDVDSLPDLYDARVGGGLPQAGPPSALSCLTGNDCREGVTVPVAPGSPGTGTTTGAGNVSAGCLALQARAGTAKRRSRALARQARKAKRRQARSLRHRAVREAKVAGHLDRRAGVCTGGGR